MTIAILKIQQNQNAQNFYQHYSEFNFSSLRDKSYYSENAFIGKRNAGLTFIDTVKPYYTGNELFYYPLLASALRNMPVYPIVKRTCAIDNRYTGIAFLKHLYTEASQTLETHQLEINQLGQQITQYVALYGEKRYTPIIDQFEKARQENKWSNTLIIQGVSWKLVCNQYDLKEDDNLTTYICVRKLFEISYNDYEKISIETALPGTPYIAVRLAKTLSHRGQVIWFNLDTQKTIARKVVFNNN